ncbi:RICIN domain-containing protein [Streptomyces sp. NPDC004561]
MVIITLSATIDPVARHGTGNQTATAQQPPTSLKESTPFMRKKLGKMALAGMAALATITPTASPASASTTSVLTNTSADWQPLCATPQGNATSNGTIVTTWGCTGSSLQQWTFTGDITNPSSSGFIVNEPSGKCLTPSGNASGTNGAVLTLWTCTGQTVQRWFNVGDQVLAYDSSKCITNKGGSMHYGVYLTLWDCSTPSRSYEQSWSMN